VGTKTFKCLLSVGGWFSGGGETDAHFTAVLRHPLWGEVVFPGSRGWSPFSLFFSPAPVTLPHY